MCVGHVVERPLYFPSLSHHMFEVKLEEFFPRSRRTRNVLFVHMECIHGHQGGLSCKRYAKV